MRKLTIGKHVFSSRINYVLIDRVLLETIYCFSFCAFSSCFLLNAIYVRNWSDLSDFYSKCIVRNFYISKYVCRFSTDFNF